MVSDRHGMQYATVRGCVVAARQRAGGKQLKWPQATHCVTLNDTGMNSLLGRVQSHGWARPCNPWCELAGRAHPCALPVTVPASLRHTHPLARPAVLPPCSDQLARAKDRLRVDVGHLSHPVYGAPELATALVDNPAEYLPIVSVLGCCKLSLKAHGC